MRLKFIEPLLPTLVEKPPEGDGWIHEVKFDGYRSQIVIDPDFAFTRNRANWTAKYRDLVGAAKQPGLDNAIIDGEVVIMKLACPTSPSFAKPSRDATISFHAT
ncbi:hypothetical protein [Mesorhizobium sp. STM 4661]|uniref:ATP-dependent DNA ligase n=1 Tax=Mesorhizobium sp. STM 4661 TaxID=1297570 RepID=UPI0002BDB957